MQNKFIDILINNMIESNWNGKKVWVAIDIAKHLEYENPSKIVNYFITAKNLLKGEDYELLSKEELRKFKKELSDNGITQFRQSPRLILFYENGLNEFLRYRSKLSYSDMEEVLGITHEVCESKTNGVVVKTFKGYKFYTFIWKKKQCWIGIEVAEVLEYIDRPKAIHQCIVSEEFELGIDYDVLYNTEIKELIKRAGGTPISNGEHIKHLTILYKEGLLGFINYAHMPVGKEFRKWLRREVFTDIIELETGIFIEDNKYQLKNKECDNSNKIKLDNLNNGQNIKDLLEIFKMVDRIVDDKQEIKFEYLNSILNRI